MWIDDPVPMRAHVIVLVSIDFYNSAQMRLDRMIDTLAPDRSDQPFGIAILPRRGRSRRLVPDAQGAKSACDNGAIDTIPIADQVVRRVIPENASVSWRAIHSAVG